MRIGINRVTKQDVCRMLNVRNVTWKAFVWYIADYCDITNWGKTQEWIDIRIVSYNQSNFLENRFKEYNELMCVGNYEVDITNILWKTHKQGVTRNPVLIEELVK